MSLAQQDREIGGTVFRLQQLPAFRAMRMKIRLLRVVGGPLLLALASGEQKVTLDLVAAIVGALFDRLTPEEYEAIVKELLAGATVLLGDKWAPLLDGFDLIMRGRMLDLVKLIGFALEVNYQDFFGAAKGLGVKAALAKAFGSATSSTSPATGPGGESSTAAGPL